MKVINIDKLKEFDIAAEYHQAWHESCDLDDKDGHPSIMIKDIPKKYRTSIPEDVFKFIHAYRGFVIDSIIKECSEEI